MDVDDKILEDASELCHIEWMNWSQNISKDLNEVVQLLNSNVEYLEEKSIDEENKNHLIKENRLLREKITEKLERWESLWIPYKMLSEEMKEEDRVYARKILNLIDKE